MVNVMSDANLLEMNTKHSCVSSTAAPDDSVVAPPPFGTLVTLVFAIKLKNFLTPFSSAQYDILCNGNWCRIFVPRGSCTATPSTLIVISTFLIFKFEPDSAFLICCENCSRRIASLTVSIPFAWSTAVLPRNCCTEKIQNWKTIVVATGNQWYKPKSHMYFIPFSFECAENGKLWFKHFIAYRMRLSRIWLYTVQYTYSEHWEQSVSVYLGWIRIPIIYCSHSPFFRMHACLCWSLSIITFGRRHWMRRINTNRIVFQ